MVNGSHVNGGFFWAQDSPAIRVREGVAMTLNDNVIMGRPNWWQVIAWYRVVRAILSLPRGSPTSGEPRPAAIALICADS